VITGRPPYRAMADVNRQHREIPACGGFTIPVHCGARRQEPPRVTAMSVEGDDDAEAAGRRRARRQGEKGVDLACVRRLGRIESIARRHGKLYPLYRVVRRPGARVVVAFQGIATPRVGRIGPRDGDAHRRNVAGKPAHALVRFRILARVCCCHVARCDGREMSPNPSTSARVPTHGSA
jgi:hypothetical protein